MMIEEKDAGGPIRSLRDALGWSQEKLARAVDCSTRHLSRWEAGEWKPSPAAIISMLKIAPTDETAAGLINLIPDFRLTPSADQETVTSRAIRTLRESLGITQGEAARRAGIEVNVWKVWEYGLRTPSPESCDKIASIAGDDKGKRMKFFVDVFSADATIHPVTHHTGGRKTVDAHETAHITRLNAIINSAKNLTIEAAEGSKEAGELLKKLSEDIGVAKIPANGKRPK